MIKKLKNIVYYSAYASEIEKMAENGIDSIDSIIDAYSGAMKSLCSNSVYKIIPILIFRQIKY